MDFGHLISESFHITLKYKVLWIFGIISAIFGGFPQAFNFSFNMSGGFGSSSGMVDDRKDTIFTGLDFVKYIDPDTLALVIALMVIVFLTIIFFAIYIQTWAYAALISQTLNIVKGKTPTFKEGKVIGEKFFWRIFLFRFVFGLVLIPVILLLLIPPLLFFIVGQNSLAIAFVIIDVIIFVLGITIYSIAVGIISEFGIRKMIEGNLKVRESIEVGWELLRDNLGKSLLVWLVNIALGFALGFAFFITMMVFLIVGVVFFLLNPWLVLIPIILFLVTISIFGGIWNVFAFSYWSLAYTQIVKGGRADAARSDGAAGSANTTAS